MPSTPKLYIDDHFVIDFYEKNPQYDFAVINGIIVELLKTLSRTSAASPQPPPGTDVDSFVEEIENIKQDYIDEIRDRKSVV